MIKGAIFDLDGTLLDSMFIWDTIGEDYLRSLGKEPKENLKEVFKTFGLEQAAHYYRENYGVALSVREIISGVNKMVENYYRDSVLLKPGVKEFLKKLKECGVKMCIATVTDKSFVEAALVRLGVRDYFSEIFTCASVGHSKEEPHIYREAQKHLKTEKSETVVFEDALYALKTAKTDGFITVAVFDIHEKNQTKLKTEADGYITDYSEFDKFWNSITNENKRQTGGTTLCRSTKIMQKGECKMRTALTIAGSDSCGGAGIQADIKTMTMNGVYAMSTITALTAQNTTGVRSVLEVTPEFLGEQLDAVFEDIFPDAVKIGMVSSLELIDMIANKLCYYKAKNIVVDPVMVATSGSRLINENAVEALKSKLLPIATLVTPNIPEAEVLSGKAVKNKADMLVVAREIGEGCKCSVLLKGGHSINDANDLLYWNGECIWIEGNRISNPNTHGTGCTLSSAVASNLAKGLSMKESVEKAKEYISGALSAGLDLGKGSGPMNHAFVLMEGLEK